MNASKFTPGPWFEFGRDQFVIDSFGGKSARPHSGAICTFCYSPPYSDPNQFFDNYHANARLIAAAPELYEALAGLLSIFDSVTMGQEAERRDEWLPKARAALAKAVQS